MGKKSKLVIAVMDRVVRASAVFGTYRNGTPEPWFLQGEKQPRVSPVDLLLKISKTRSSQGIDEIMALLPSNVQQALGSLAPWQIDHIAAGLGGGKDPYRGGPGFDTSSLAALLDEHPSGDVPTGEGPSQAALDMALMWATTPPDQRVESLRHALTPSIVEELRKYGTGTLFATLRMDEVLQERPHPINWPPVPERPNEPIDWKQVGMSLSGALGFFGVRAHY